MRIVFSENGWDESTIWPNDDKKVLVKINELLKDISNHPFVEIEKPEPLKHKLSGYWSRRITQEHRLVCQIDENDVIVVSCKYHY